ncbi:hypothetical protein ASD13_06375 [Microbacterium sp. Root1433D1]|nr:hypothetical protein ASD13_06375 [Microbacterium sp. Root1433D1]
MEALRLRVATLERENEELRAPAAALRSAGRRTGRSILSFVLIALGIVVGGAGLVSSYAKQQLLDTTNFVSTFAPLATDSAVQDVAGDAILSAIDDAVDIPALTADVITGIRELDLPPRADLALQLLEAPAAQGLQGLIDSSVAAIVASDTFSAAWEQMLRISHTQMMATVRGDDAAAVTLSDGALQLQIGPLVAEVKERLLARGFTLAESIPAVDRSIDLVEGESFEQIRAVVNAVDVAGSWLPWASLVLIVAGVLTARHRQRALIGASFTTAVLMTSVAIALTVAGGIFVRVASRSPGVITGIAAQHVYDAATRMMSQMSVAIATLAVAVAVVAWLSGPSAAAVAVRTGITSAGRSVQQRAEKRGLSSGRLGLWLDGNHRIALVAVGVAAAAVILLLRPLSPAVIICTAVVSMVAVLAIQFVRRPVESLPDSTALSTLESTLDA